MKLISNEDGIDGITSQVSGKAYLDLLEVREPVLLCGVDAETYFPLFPGIVLEEGRFLRAGEYGAMITSERAQRIEKKSGRRPVIDTPLLLTSGGATGFKIREIPLVGIFSYQNPGEFMNEIVITDPQTVRVLNSIQVASAANEAAEEKFINLPLSNLDSIFDETYEVNAEAGEAEFSVGLLHSYLDEAKTKEGDKAIGGDWNFIILRLKKGISTAAFILSLNKKIGLYGVTAVNWRISSGSSAILPLLIQVLFNAGVFLVGVASVIAVINILLLSVFRRVREIGTLRAIGAPDAYIRCLIYSENFVIAATAGLLGVLGGVLFSQWVNSLNLRISNELLVSIMGGQILRLEFLPHITVISVLISILLGLAASVYPVETAVRVVPEAAVRRG
jgi:ABC-type lipoprotein release transport system permease subunit